jgi:hypothetical protein
MLTPKVRILKRSQIDDAKWNQAIRQAVNSLPYAYTWYLDSLCSRWVALVVNEYDFVMPVPVGRKWGMRYVYQPLFCQQLGVFYKRRSDTIIDLMLDFATKKFIFVNLNGNYHNLHPSLVRKGLVLKKNLVLSLDGSLREIQNGYTDNTNRNIKKGQKAGLVFAEEETNAFEAFTDFYIAHTAHKDAKFKEKNIASLKRLVQQFIIHECGRMYTARTPGGDMCAGVIVVENNKRIIHLLPAADDYARQNGGMHFLVNEVLGKYAASGMIYDFEGSSVDSIARFYEGFGAENEPFFVLGKSFFQGRN